MINIVLGYSQIPTQGIILILTKRVEGDIFLHLKEDLSNRYTRLVYNGYWFSPERKSLQRLIDDSQKNVTGTVKIKLFKGNVIVLGRKSQYSLYSEDLSTFEADSGDYNQRDAEGFIKVNSLRLRNKQK